MRCIVCDETLVHEDELVDGMCRKCTKRGRGVITRWNLKKDPKPNNPNITR